MSVCVLSVGGLHSTIKQLFQQLRVAVFINVYCESVQM